MSSRFPGQYKLLCIFILLCFTWLLVGCGTTQKEYVSKPEVRLVEVPRHLLQKCTVTAPPHRDSFVAMSEKQQVDVLSTYSVNLLGDLKNCNDQITGIVTFQVNQKKIIDDANKDAK